MSDDRAYAIWERPYLTDPEPGEKDRPPSLVVGPENLDYASLYVDDDEPSDLALSLLYVSPVNDPVQ